MQWRDEVKKFGVNPVAPSLESDTNKALTRLFRGLRGGGTHVAIITNNLLCTPSFQSTVVEKIHSRGRTVPTMLIADEAHTLGAESFVNNKPEFFEKRLALSATPERHSRRLYTTQTEQRRSSSFSDLRSTSSVWIEPSDSVSSRTSTMSTRAR